MCYLCSFLVASPFASFEVGHKHRSDDVRLSTGISCNSYTLDHSPTKFKSFFEKTSVNTIPMMKSRASSLLDSFSLTSPFDTTTKIKIPFDPKLDRSRHHRRWDLPTQIPLSSAIDSSRVTGPALAPSQPGPTSPGSFSSRSSRSQRR